MIIVISKSLKIQEHIISGCGGVYFGNLEEFVWDLEAFVDAVHLWSFVRSFVRESARRQQHDNKKPKYLLLFLKSQNKLMGLNRTFIL